MQNSTDVMSTNVLKQAQVRITLNHKDATRVRALAESIHQSDAWVVKTICESGLRALEETKGKLTLPLDLKMAGMEPGARSERPAGKKNVGS